MLHPRQIDEPLVDAYLARRALDYLVGFTLSPILWRKLPGSRSAGRVQSVALRIVCDRENEIEQFKAGRILVGRRQAASKRARASRPASIRSTARSPTSSTSRPATKPTALKARDRGRPLRGPLGRQEADQAQPLCAVHHLEPAAGCLLAPRLLAQPHHADRAAPLRGRRHHLYANRRHRHGARGHRRGAQRHREGVRLGLSAADAAHLSEQGQERAGSARGHPADRHVPASRHGRRSRTSASSTA